MVYSLLFAYIDYKKLLVHVFFFLKSNKNTVIFISWLFRVRIVHNFFDAMIPYYFYKKINVYLIIM